MILGKGAVSYKRETPVLQVLGQNGQQTVVTISFKSLFTSASADWRPPTVTIPSLSLSLSLFLFLSLFPSFCLSVCLSLSLSLSASLYLSLSVSLSLSLSRRPCIPTLLNAGFTSPPRLSASPQVCCRPIMAHIGQSRLDSGHGFQGKDPQ